MEFSVVSILHSDASGVGYDLNASDRKATDMLISLVGCFIINPLTPGTFRKKVRFWTFW